MLVCGRAGDIDGLVDERLLFSATPMLRCPAWETERSERILQDEVTALAFWAGRDKMTRILDETALLAVAIYVDLTRSARGSRRRPRPAATRRPTTASMRTDRRVGTKVVARPPLRSQRAATAG